jgi:hypothetical protein
MIRSLPVLLLSLALVIGWAPAALAKDAVVVLGPVAVGTGSATCYALNVGKINISNIKVDIRTNDGHSYTICSNVFPSAGYSSLCSFTYDAAGDYWCRVEITGGTTKDVITRFNVEDEDGNTILSLGPE